MNGRACVILMLAGVAFGAGPGPVAAQGPATTVIVVRHAEKAAQPEADPHLSPDGRARAETLARALKDAGVTAVITTQYRRTVETGAPTAREFRLTPVVVSETSQIPKHASAVAEAVMKHAGGTVLVVGHSNTVAAIVQALGAPRPAELCDAEYDALFVVSVTAEGRATVVKARYGKATPVAEGCGNSMR